MQKIEIQIRLLETDSWFSCKSSHHLPVVPPASGSPYFWFTKWWSFYALLSKTFSWNVVDARYTTLTLHLKKIGFDIVWSWNNMYYGRESQVKMTASLVISSLQEFWGRRKVAKVGNGINMWLELSFTLERPMQISQTDKTNSLTSVVIKKILWRQAQQRTHISNGLMECVYRFNNCSEYCISKDKC